MYLPGPRLSRKTGTSRKLLPMKSPYCVWWFEFLAMENDTVRRCGLIGGSVALLEEVWPCWRKYVAVGVGFEFLCSRSTQCGETLLVAACRRESSSTWLWIKM